MPPRDRPTDRTAEPEKAIATDRNRPPSPGRVHHLCELQRCLSWIRSLRRLRRDYGLGTMEKAAIAENLREARQHREALRVR